MSNLDVIIKEMLQIDGAMGAAIVDDGSGMALAYGGPAPFPMDVVAASAVDIIRSFNTASANVGVPTQVENIVGIYDDFYFFIRQLLGKNAGLGMLVVLDRGKANQAMANHQLGLIAAKIVV